MRKFPFGLLLALVCSAGASAQTLCQWRDTLTNSIGQAIPGATAIILSGTIGGSAAVNTNTQPGTPLATIYADPYGLVPINQTTNPINTASGDGTFQFWGTCGAYLVIQAYGPQISGQYVYGIRLSGSSVSGGSSGQSLANVAAAVVGANTLTWNRLGTVIGTPFQGGGTISQQEPSAFVQTSPQVLSSAYPQVVGMIYTCNAFNICYAEAPHPEGPFTPYSGNPVIANAGCSSNILTIGGQLVMFACVNSRTDIHRYHSTTHGLSWVDDGLVIAHGGAAWTSYSVDNSSILIVGGVCYLWFDGGANATSFGQGLMTGNSTCAQSSFIENPGDPAIPSTELNGGGPFVYYDGTNFWQWELGGATTANAYPSYVYFTELNTNGFGTPAPHTHTQILLPRFDDEGGGQTGVEVQDADPFVFEWPYAQGDSRNTSYLYYSSCAENCNAPLLQQFTLKVASIPMPMSEIVKIPQADQAVESDHVGWQFVNGISSVNPLPVPTMFDNANRPNSVNMGNDWIAVSSNLQAAIVNNQFEQSASTPFTARPLYARVQPNADQFSSVQLIAAASTSNIGTIVRGSPTVVSFYECVTQNALGTSQTIVIRKYVNGSGFTTVATQTGTPQVNDWMMLKAVGSTLTCTIYDPSGNITLSGTDTSIAKGLPGFEIADSAAQGNAILDNWSGGSVYGDGSAATQQTQYWSQPQTFASVIASGIVDGQTHTIVTTIASVSLADGYSKTIANNQEATAGAAVTYTLPAAVAGLTKCVINSNNGSAPDTGVLTLQTSGSGQYIIFTDGTLSASGGYVSSGGAAADNACVQGVDATHWQLFVQSGTWAKH